MSDLSEFLLARIAEDEHETRWLGPCDCHVEGFPLQHGLRCAERVLAECNAKRRLVERFADRIEISVASSAEKQYVPGAEDTGSLRLLALPYADHPDYDEEWRP